jgi:rubrerythrin
MNLDEALKTALEFENKVHRTYARAATRTKDAHARRIFSVLAREELGHVSYLENCLVEWRKSGRLASPKLETAIPTPEKIRLGLQRLRAKVAPPKTAPAAELDLLKQALAAENETAAFYRNSVSQLPVEGQKLFARFMQIEEGHGALVQAEINALEHSGFYYDLQEFDLESA